MKKVLLSIVMALLSIEVFAIKAFTCPVVFTQSDGTKITVYGHGDEDFSWYTDSLGNILLRNGNDFTPYSGNKETFFANANKTLKASILRREPVQTLSTYFPHTGSPKALVILVNYSDTTFTLPNPKKSFDYFLNGNVDPTYTYVNGEKENYGSVKQYFKDMSGGTFTPVFDVHGPVTLSNTLQYYGRGANDINYTEIIDEAMKLMDDSLDYSQYDSNGDGYIDLLYVIYAGYGANTTQNSTDCIWPKSFNYTTATYDGVKTYRCGLSNELNAYLGAYKSAPSRRISGIGLFIHEFSHCMGLPDFYSTTAASTTVRNADNQEMEYWSIMDAGCYTPKGNGTVPISYTAWEREAMGWTNIETLKTSGEKDLTNIDDGGKAYRIYNDNDATNAEYYIIQNIQKTGWNSKAYGHGLMVTHVDYSQSLFSLSSNSVNNTLNHPRMTVLAADGSLKNSYGITTSEYFNAMSGDLFPGTSNVTNLTDTSAVKPIVYTGSALGKPIYDITENADGTITFYFLTDKKTTGINQPIVEATNTDKRIYNINGLYVGTDTSILPKGIYIINKKKIIIR